MVVGLAGGCGPQVIDPSEGASTSTTDVATTTQGTTVGTTTTGPTTTTSVDDTSPADSSTDPEMTSLVFIEDPTGGPVDCDIWDQDCPVGEKCVPWANDGGSSWNATRCAPVAEEPHAPGESCTVEGNAVSGLDDCDYGSMCWDVDPETMMGECVAFCMGTEANPICEDACTSCTINSSGILNLCLPMCDPLGQNCNEGEGCYPVNDTFACAPDASGDMGGVAEVCEFLNVCDPGSACIPPDMLPACEGSYGCCSPFCDVAAADTCDALLPGTVCRPWWDGGGPQGCSSGEIGVCALPP